MLRILVPSALLRLPLNSDVSRYMSQIVIASSGNAQAPALGLLRELGYVVSNVPGHSELLQALNERFRLLANEPLELLGLALLASHRGASLAPTDAEISELLRLEPSSGA